MDGDNPGLALGGKAVDQVGQGQNFGTEHIAGLVTGAAIGGGIADTHTLETTRIVSRDTLALDCHSNLGMTEMFRGGIRAFGHNIA